MSLAGAAAGAFTRRLIDLPRAGDLLTGVQTLMGPNGALLCCSKFRSRAHSTASEQQAAGSTNVIIVALASRGAQHAWPATMAGLFGPHGAHLCRHTAQTTQRSAIQIAAGSRAMRVRPGLKSKSGRGKGKAPTRSDLIISLPAANRANYFAGRQRRTRATTCSRCSLQVMNRLRSSSDFGSSFGLLGGARRRRLQTRISPASPPHFARPSSFHLSISPSRHLAISASHRRTQEN